MRIVEIINSCKSQEILTESWTTLTEDQQIYLKRFETELWPLVENLKTVLEADLTANQIQQVFQSAEEVVSAGPGGQTAFGKAADVAKLPAKAMQAINSKLDELGGLLQQTAPVKAFDQQFAKLQEKIKERLGDNSKIMSAVEKYGNWAKENPGKSAFVIGVLTAAASISAGPGGGAAAGFLLRSASELAKGEKLSTAVGKSAKTAGLGALGGMAFNALSDAMAENIFNATMDDINAQAQAIENANVQKALADVQSTYGDIIPGNLEEFRHLKLRGNINSFFYNYDLYASPEQLEKIKELKTAMNEISRAGMDSAAENPEWVRAASQFHDYLATLQQAPQQETIRSFTHALETAKGKGLTIDQLRQVVGEYEKADQALQRFKQAGGWLAAAVQGGAQMADKAAKNAVRAKSPKTESIVETFMFSDIIVEQQLYEKGFMDRLKAGAGKLAGKAKAAAQQTAKNIGYTVTADKLMKKWKSMGEPTDVESILRILGSFGVKRSHLADIEKSSNVDLSMVEPDSEDFDLEDFADQLLKTDEVEEIKKYLSVQLA